MKRKRIHFKNKNSEIRRAACLGLAILLGAAAGTYPGAVPSMAGTDLGVSTSAAGSYPGMDTSAAETYPGMDTSVAATRDQEALKALGAARKAEIETLANQTKAPYTTIYWTITDPAFAANPFAPNDGIALGALFYSSVDHVWEPLGETEYYVNSVRQHGADTGTVYVSWSNGRGRFFPYSAAEYSAMTQVIERFYQTYIREDMTDFEKELQIIQYLVANVTYAYGRYTSGTDNAHDHNAYGALVIGEAVCEGYAEAFCLLADRCGLPAGFIYGSFGGEAHDWNTIKLDGSWYHVDVTSEDPVLYANYGNPYTWGNLKNRYINLTDTQMQADHIWDHTTTYPCTSQVFGAAAVAKTMVK